MGGGKGDNFHVTYKYILNNDIRYMYSGYPADFMCRGSGDYPNWDMLRIARENTDFRQNILKISRHGGPDTFLLPRAPAFRDVPREKVDGIVTRLLNNKVNGRKRPLPNYEPVRTRFPSYRRLSYDDLNMSTLRLHHTGTHMSKLKARDPKVVKETLPIMKNRPDPDRMILRNPMPVVDI